MFKALLRKQFIEIFRTYYIDKKTGKANSPKKTAGKFALYGIILLAVSLFFFAFFSSMVGLAEGDQPWLYFSVASLFAAMLGIFGSVFSTAQTLFMPKDNDLLFAMPIPPVKILLVRMSGVYGLSLLYSALIWIPALVRVWLFRFTVSSLIYGLLLTLVLALLVTVLTSLLGWVVAFFSARAKNKSAVTMILSLILFAAYYLLWSRISSMAELITQNQSAIADALSKWGYVFMLIGKGAAGEGVPFALFCLIALCAGAVCMAVLSASFGRIVATAANARKKTKSRTVRARSVSGSLLLRELKRFCSSPAYMLNCGPGILMLPVVSVIFILRRNAFASAIASAGLPEKSLPLLMAAVVTSFVLSIDNVAVPSVSLEGKTLWLIKSLPVSALQVLRAKLNLHILLGLIPVAISLPLFAIAFRFDVPTVLLLILLYVSLLYFTGNIGLLLGLKYANFTWTSETYIIKQNVAVLFGVFAGFGVTGTVAVFLVAGLFLPVPAWVMLVPCDALLCLAAFLASRGLKKKGCATFDRL